MGIKYGYAKTEQRFVSKGDRFQVIQGMYKHSRVLLCTEVEIRMSGVYIYHDNDKVKSPLEALDCHKVKMSKRFVK